MRVLKAVRSSRLGNRLLWFVRFRIAKYPRLVQDEHVMMELLPAGSVLDLGCARGDLLRALRAKGWRGQYEGVDFSKAAISEAKRMGDPGARFWVSDLERLSLLPNRRWDAISLIECVYYLNPSYLPALFAMLWEHVAENGKLIVRMYETEKLAAHAQAFTSLFPDCESILVNEDSGRMFVARNSRNT